MARYAEWNKFIGTLKTDTWGVTNVNEVGIAFEKATADVVPKSEVDKLKIAYEGSQKTIKGLTETIREKNKELAKLETHLELHYGQRSLNNLIAEEKAELAREIFAEIESLLDKHTMLIRTINGLGNMVFSRTLEVDIAELKNKYAEGNYDRT